jgi:2-polyprenyl-3-methyl-5-hydroxy-6-metoxy-1,4-benzoquinol methylase
VAELLPESGRCLDIASGTGAVTLWLAQQGLEVTALEEERIWEHHCSA